MSEHKIPVPTLAPEDLYHLVRGQIEHEDNLIGTRLNWFVASQSFLFSAYAIVVSNLTTTVKSPWVNSQQKLLFAIIPVVAIFVCVLIFIGALGGILAMRALRRSYAAQMSHLVGFGLPPVQGFAANYFMGQLSPALLPPGFVAVWLLLLLHGIH
jgi:hypothetical protein